MPCSAWRTWNSRSRLDGLSDSVGSMRTTRSDTVGAAPGGVQCSAKRICSFEAPPASQRGSRISNGWLEPRAQQRLQPCGQLLERDHAVRRAGTPLHLAREQSVDLGLDAELPPQRRDEVGRRLVVDVGCSHRHLPARSDQAAALRRLRPARDMRSAR
jgi:hypothetical protein